MKWSKDFTTNYVDPLIAAKYPAYKGKSPGQRRDKAGEALLEYLQNTGYAASTVDMASAAWTETTYRIYQEFMTASEVRARLTDESARDAFTASLTPLFTFQKAWSDVYMAYALLVNGPGSFLMLESPISYKSACDGAINMLNADLRILSAAAAPGTQEKPEEVLEQILGALSSDNLDEEIVSVVLEYTPDAMTDLENSRRALVASFGEFMSARRKWLDSCGASPEAVTALERTPALMLAKMLEYTEQ